MTAADPMSGTAQREIINSTSLWMDLATIADFNYFQVTR